LELISHTPLDEKFVGSTLYSSKQSFSNQKVEVTYQFLLSEFAHDLFCKKLDFDESGWRTLSQLSNLLGLSRHEFYGRNGTHGPIVLELIARGAIETKISKGERGRGGEILRIRIALGVYETIKEFCLAAAGGKLEDYAGTGLVTRPSIKPRLDFSLKKETNSDQGF
jgi:hypothetical protein